MPLTFKALWHYGIHCAAAANIRTNRLAISCFTGLLMLENALALVVSPAMLLSRRHKSEELQTRNGSEVI